MNYLDDIIGSFAGAFFAFIFFVVGQGWIKSNEKRDKIINDLNIVKEFIAAQVPIIMFNKKKAEEFRGINTDNPIQIFIKRFDLFVLDNFFYTKINKYKVLESIIYFWSHLSILNEDMRTLNDTFKELSYFSRIAIIENKEKSFKQTMKNNSKDLRGKIKIIQDRIDDIKETPGSIIDEINFCLWYERAYFWNKYYFRLRYKFDKNYKKKKIDKIKDRYEK